MMVLQKIPVVRFDLEEHKGGGGGGGVFSGGIARVRLSRASLISHRPRTKNPPATHED